MEDVLVKGWLMSFWDFLNGLEAENTEDRLEIIGLSTVEKACECVGDSASFV